MTDDESILKAAKLTCFTIIVFTISYLLAIYSLHIKPPFFSSFNYIRINFDHNQIV